MNETIKEQIRKQLSVLDESQILCSANRIIKEYNDFNSIENAKNFINAKMRALMMDLVILEEAEHIQDMQDTGMID